MGLILARIILQISAYLDKKGKKYKLRAHVWRDVESEDWEENVIEVEYREHEEKMKIWKELCDLVYKNNQNITLLVEVERFK